GLLALPRALAVPLGRLFGSSFLATTYMTAGITILASWAAIVPWFSREFGIRGLTVIVILCVASPFLLFNTVYTWPKMLGASYVVIAYLLLTRVRTATDRGASLVFVALCGCLAYLAHGSNVIALIPLGLAFFPAILMAGPLPIVAAVVAIIIIDAPWIYWQLFIQPGGNALVRYLLAGDFAVGQTSVIKSTVDAYRYLGIEGWLHFKLSQICLMLGLAQSSLGVVEAARYSPGTGTLGSARILDFSV